LQKNTGAPKAAMIIATGQLMIRRVAEIGGIPHSEQSFSSSIVFP